jgi:Tol biopolymer transport system component
MSALLVAAVLVACAAAVATLLAVSKEAEATFPGKNGRIAYGGGGVIYTINPDGSAKRRVTDTSSGGDPIGYSPDGKRITYTDYEGFNGKDTEIYTIGVDGKNRVRLTNNATNDGFPVYSPDGKRIAAWSEKGQYIYTIGVHGGGKSKVVGGSDPSYSPNGRRIAYTGRRFFERDAEIYTVNVDGSHRTKVTNNDSIDYRPSYSPDGKKIAYIGGRGLNPDIYTRSVGGGGKSNKVTGGSHIWSNPSWGSRP